MTISNKKEDLRIRRTIFLLKRSVENLLQENSLDSITVSDICDKAMVHRTTFYKHFSDKYDLCNAILMDLKQEIIEDSKAEKAFESTEEFFHYISKKALDYLSANKIMLSGIVRHNKDSLLYFIGFHAIESAIYALLKENQEKISNHLPLDISTQFLTAGLLSVMLNWVEHDTKHSYGDMLEIISNIIKKNLYY